MKTLFRKKWDSRTLVKGLPISFSIAAFHVSSRALSNLSSISASLNLENVKYDELSGFDRN